MTISEPMTLLTDWMLAGLCLVLGWALLREPAASRSRRWLGGALLGTALAALVGGASHGFRAHLGATGNVVAWKVTVLSIGVTGFLFLGAAALSALSPRGRRIVLTLAATEAILYCLWMLWHDEFIWVIADYVPAMLVALGLQVVDWRRGRPSAPWLAGGIVTSFAGAGIQASGLAPHPSFNHNDLYHVIQMVACWLMYRGGLLLTDHDD